MSLVGWWRLDETLEDDSGYDNHASGSASYVNGKIGQAIDSNSSGAITVPIMPQIEDVFSGEEFTLSLWWRQYDHTDAPRWDDLIQYKNINGNTMRLERAYSDRNTNESDYYSTIGSDGNISSNGIGVNAGEWFHIVLRRKKDELSTWINGEKYQTQSPSSDEMVPIDSSSTFYINRGSTGSELDNLRLYTNAISDESIKRLSQAKIGHWKLNDSKDCINNFYDSDGTWSANYGSNASVETDTSIPSYPEDDQKIVLEKNADESAGDDDQWHGTHFDGNAQEISVEVGDVFSFSGWYKLYDETGNPQTTFSANHQDAETSWDSHGVKAISLQPDNTWHRFEFTAEITSSPPSGRTQPYWKWGYDYGYQRLELCGLQMQKSPSPSSNFVKGQSSRNGIASDCSGYDNHGVKYGTRIDTNTPIHEQATWFSTENSSYIKIPDVGSSDNFTFTFWVRSDIHEDGDSNTNDWAGLIGCSGQGNMLLMETGGSLTFREPDNDPKYTGGGDMVEGEWEFICISLNSDGRKRIYQNGSLQTEEMASIDGNITIGELWLGANSNVSSTHILDGSMSDVQLYATELSQETIQRIYENRASLDDQGNFHTHELVEYDTRTLIEDKPFTPSQDDYSVLANPTPADTDFSDWVEDDNSLGNVILTGEVYITTTEYGPSTIEFTRDNNARGMYFRPQNSDTVIDNNSWEKGWNEFLCPVGSWDTLDNTPWENMTRLQLYHSGPTAGDTSQEIRYRNVKIHKLQSESEMTKFNIGEDGVSHSLEFDETLTDPKSRGMKDTISGLCVNGSIDETQAVSHGNQDIIQDGLLLHLNASENASYDGSGTTWNDISGNGHHAYGSPNAEGSGTNSSHFPTWQSDNGGRFYFNNDAGLTITSDMGSPSEVTHEIWLQRGEPSTDGLYIFDGRNAGGDWFIANYNGYNINLENNIQANWPTTNQSESHWWDHWIHLVVMTDGSSSRLFVDGEEITDDRLVSSSGFSTNLGQYFRIGTRYTRATDYIGYMSTYRIYDRMLEPEEVAYNHAMTKWRHYYG